MNKNPMLLIVLAILFFNSCKEKELVLRVDKSKMAPTWYAYCGNSGGQRYVPLEEINLTNVKDLEIAWTYENAGFCVFVSVESFAFISE